MNLYKKYQNRKNDEEIRKNDTDALSADTQESTPIIIYEKSNTFSTLMHIIKIIVQSIIFLGVGFGIAVLIGYATSFL